ncbi:MAG: ferric reductase-like transmembrane domain-containing protein [Acidimicrobiales bacterium]
MAAAIAIPSQLLWYVTRSSGLIAFGLITAAVVLGVLGAERFRTSERPRIHYAELHRGIALFGTVMLAVHILTAVVDPFTHLGWTSIFDPFGRTYRPLYLALGIAAFDLLLAVVVTSLLRKHLPLTLWKRIHFVVYPVWVAGVMHGLGTGTDSKFLIVQIFYLVSLAIVVVAVWVRVLSGDVGSRLARFGLGTLALAVPALVMIWAYRGPVLPSWSSHFVSSRSVAVSTAGSQKQVSHEATHEGSSGEPNDSRSSEGGSRDS